MCARVGARQPGFPSRGWYAESETRMPIVLVEISPPGSPPALARALVDACSSAVRDGTCELDAEPATLPDTIAIVRWNDSEERRARVQVGQRRTGDPDWQAKDSRLSGVGFTRRALAIGRDSRSRRSRVRRRPAPAPDVRDEPAAGEDVSVHPPKAEPVVPPPAPAPVEPRRRCSAPTTDVTADRDTRKSRTPSKTRESGSAWEQRSGTGLHPGGPRFGGRRQCRMETEHGSRVRAESPVGFAVRPSNSLGLSAQWETLTLAAGAILERGPFALEPWLGGGLVAHSGGRGRPHQPAEATPEAEFDLDDRRGRRRRSFGRGKSASFWGSLRGAPVRRPRSS